MNIHKKLALFGALALPFAGLATFGGVQAASAASPVLTCQAVSPAAGSNGGESFTAKQQRLGSGDLSAWCVLRRQPCRQHGAVVRSKPCRRGHQPVPDRPERCARRLPSAAR